MPPGHGDDGLRAAIELRSRSPGVGILVLSQFYEQQYALDLIGDRGEGVGYLLKERVGDVDAFIDAVRRVAQGGSALDPEIVARMLGRRRSNGPLDTLSPRELDVLAAMAEGKSNHGIAEALFVSDATVEKHVTSLFHKLGLNPGPTEHRRVLAVLTYMEGGGRPSAGSAQPGREPLFVEGVAQPPDRLLAKLGHATRGDVQDLADLGPAGAVRGQGHRDALAGRQGCDVTRQLIGRFLPK